MDNLTVNILAYPVLPYTMLLALVSLYWLTAALGLVDIEIFDLDGSDLDADGDSLEGLTGLLARLGLNGVPITVVVTLIALYGWAIISTVCLFWGVFIQGLSLIHI